MEGGTSDRPKWSFSWASHDDEMNLAAQPPQFSAAYADHYEAMGLPVPPPELRGTTPTIHKPDYWLSLATTSTSTSLGNPMPQKQEHRALSERGKNTTREMIFRIAAMQPIEIDPESVKRPKRRNVKMSNDPQSVAARHRRERISERIRILQRLVPGGTKMDTASTLDEAIHYLKFLQSQVDSLQRVASHNNPQPPPPHLFMFSPANPSSHHYLPLHKPSQPHNIICNPPHFC